MALAICIGCGKNKKSGVCPPCGIKPKRTSLFTWIVTIVCGLLIVLAMSCGGDRSGSLPSHPKTPEKIETPEQSKALELAAAAERQRKLDKSRELYAFILAEEAMTKRLMTPSTAKFSSVLDTKVGRLNGGGPNKWVVKGYVDAQNGFGAMLRHNYQVVIEFEEGKNDSSRVLSADLY